MASSERPPRIDDSNPSFSGTAPSCVGNEMDPAFRPGLRHSLPSSTSLEDRGPVSNYGCNVMDSVIPGSIVQSMHLGRPLAPLSVCTPYSHTGGGEYMDGSMHQSFDGHLVEVPMKPHEPHFLQVADACSPMSREKPKFHQAHQQQQRQQEHLQQLTQLSHQQQQFRDEPLASGTSQVTMRQLQPQRQADSCLPCPLPRGDCKECHQETMSSSQDVLLAMNILQQNINALQALVPLLTKPAAAATDEHRQMDAGALQAQGIASLISQLTASAAGVLPVIGAALPSAFALPGATSVEGSRPPSASVPKNGLELELNKPGNTTGVSGADSSSVLVGESTRRAENERQPQQQILWQQQQQQQQHEHQLLHGQKQKVQQRQQCNDGAEEKEEQHHHHAWQLPSPRSAMEQQKSLQMQQLPKAEGSSSPGSSCAGHKQWTPQHQQPSGSSQQQQQQQQQQQVLKPSLHHHQRQPQQQQQQQQQLVVILQHQSQSLMIQQGDDEDESEMLPEGSYDIIEMDPVEILAEHTHFCEICGKGFKRDANLRMHMRGHGDEFKTAAALTRPDKHLKDAAQIRPKRYSCPFLGCKRNKSTKKFQPLKTLLCVKNHYRRSHCPKVLTCSKCHMKKFSVVADLKTHEKHCGRDKWMCSCGTTFSQKDKLLGHLGLFAGHIPAVPLHMMEQANFSIVQSTDVYGPQSGMAKRVYDGTDTVSISCSESVPKQQQQQQQQSEQNNHHHHQHQQHNNAGHRQSSHACTDADSGGDSDIQMLGGSSNVLHGLFSGFFDGQLHGDTTVME